ncbi:putative adipose-regulatory protein-domain-containing protein [Lophiotrema nucula]|uniref:Putative adipose-regulatory protein-domain-containing protein n=1 Tax=Lophiotrema nucula TaxID=690887 RepID=A0A6A5YY25_9PLEO|nr:putative adipose-regulatory protein-domain-containing protein [Lophiotrema nucula]
MEDTEEDYTDPPSILTRAKDALLYPLRIALSPTLLRTYLRTALLLLTSSLLFALAVIAYTSFYYAHIPIRGLGVPVYLQFQHAAPAPILDTPATKERSPFGIAHLEGLVARQKYDVAVEMVVPRSERNLGAGNWMLGLELRGPGTKGGGVKGLLGWEEEWESVDFSHGPDAGTEKEVVNNEGPGVKSPENAVVLARSRRPAILTYRSWMTESAYRVLRLPLYVVGWGMESEVVRVGMMEGVEFEKGWRNVPASLRLELRSKVPLEVYKVSVRFAAKLEGLRWVMYQYRLTSFVVFTTLFWGTEMAVVLSTWAVFTLLFSGPPIKEEIEGRKIKEEGEGQATPKTEPGDSEPTTPLSDTSRTFPTLSSQQRLHYSSGETSKIKGDRETPALKDIPPRTEAEADDEDEDEDADFILEEPVPNSAANILSDSGIGTSMESERVGDRGMVRRRSGGMRDK